MSYFSSKSTWLSLVDMAGSGNYTPDPSASGNPGFESEGSQSALLDGITLSFEDYRPALPSGSDDSHAEGAPAMSQEDLDYLRITRDLRHRLFFHFKEWEFGPALLEDHINLARLESNAEEALYHYCHARHVAVTLVKRNPQPTYLLALLEADKVIAEIHHLLGNHESCAVYAKEGLDTIKKNKFNAALDMRITKLTVQFFHLLGRS